MTVSSDVLAEREECARIADLFKEEHRTAREDVLNYGNPQLAQMRERLAKLAEDIAAAIRARPT